MTDRAKDTDVAAFARTLTDEILEAARVSFEGVIKEVRAEALAEIEKLRAEVRALEARITTEEESP